MKIHELKCDSNFYCRLASGVKTAEIRKNDRNYKVGDYLISRCFVKSVGTSTPHRVVHVITDILTDKEFPDGLQPGYVMLSVSPIQFREADLVMALRMEMDEKLELKNKLQKQP